MRRIAKHTFLEKRSPAQLNLIGKSFAGSECNLDKIYYSFLNQGVSYNDTVTWNDPAQEKLWLYNLHYFEYLLPLTGKTDSQNFRSAKTVISDWTKNNPIGQGNGWEPYPISLRVVNWIFFYDAHFNDFEKDTDFKKSFLTSLYRQIHYLTYFLEFHLLANHLWANTKALVFGGLFFNEKKWIKKGLCLLGKELEEQILPDGGHYERSPMYHSIILTDVLDLINLFQSCPDNVEFDRQKWLARLNSTAVKMLSWLQGMIHPDGDICLFGDSAFGIAPKPEQIRTYAEKLGLDCADILIAPDEKKSFRSLPDSGYYICQFADQYLAFDAGELGVTYQPGHAHCDLFSYEYSYKGQRFIVDSGVGSYLPNEIRQKARSIYAHNTVVVNGLEQGEIWSAFRLGRRVKPEKVIVNKSGNEVAGLYINNLEKQKTYKHQRTIKKLDDNSLKISDVITAENITRIESLIHFHPACTFRTEQGRVSVTHGDYSIQILFNDKEAVAEFRDWFYVPQFGKVIESKVLVLQPKNSGISSISYRISPAN